MKSSTYAWLTGAGIEKFEMSVQGSSLRLPVHDREGRVIANARYDHEAGARTAGQWTFSPPFESGSVLFNFHRALKLPGGPIIVVQQIQDCIAVDECGWPAVVATMGKGLSEVQEHELIVCGRLVVLMFAGDDEGWSESERCIQNLAVSIFVKTVVLPSNQAPHQLARPDMLAVLGAI